MCITKTEELLCRHGVRRRLLRSCGGIASLSLASSLLFNRFKLRVTMPAPKHPYSLIYIYIYTHIYIFRLYIDIYFVYLSVYDGDIQGKTKVMYKNSVSCSLTDKQLAIESKAGWRVTTTAAWETWTEAPYTCLLWASWSRAVYRKVVSTVVHLAFKEPDNSILNMRKEMPKKRLYKCPCVQHQVFDLFDVFTTE